MGAVRAICVLAMTSYTLLMLLVVRRARRRVETRYFLLYLAALMMWTASQAAIAFTSNPQVALAGYQLVLAFAAPFGFFYAMFVQGLVGTPANPLFVRTGWVFAFAVPVYLLAGGPGMIRGVYQEPGWPLYLPEVGILAALVGVAAYAYLVYALYRLVRARAATTLAVERNRFTYLIVSIPIVIVGTAANYFPATRGYPLDIGAHVINALLTTFVILRYRLLDIDLVVRKGLRYSVSTIVISGIYFLLVTLTVQVFHLVSNLQVLLLSIVMAVLAALLVEPLRTGLQARVDRQFFREKYDAARMLQRVSNSSAALLDVEQLAAMIVAEVSHTMSAQRVAIFVKDQAGGYLMVASKGLTHAPNWSFDADNPIVAYVAQHQEVFWSGDLDRVPLIQGLRLSERLHWEDLQPEMVVPISLKRALVGLLAVGPKLSGRDYSPDDQAMLMTLANQTAVAVENARLYAAVQAELVEREAAERRVLASLHEKEVLLKEIHHRVKNNLQVIYSLLSLQTRRAADPATLNVLLDSQNRIRSMALIHEKLYQSADLANVDFSEYLDSLAGHLYRSYGATGCQVKLQVNAAHVKLGIDAAVPCGLIASELIANALKHAFIGRETGLLRVALRNSDSGSVELEVTDDGVGLAPGAAAERYSSLGMQLVRGLVKQLDGSLSMENSNGARFVVSFLPRPAMSV